MYSASNVEELLTCSICLDKYNKPKMLPCQHTFCTVCLIELVKTSSDSEKRRQLLVCPQCRVSHKIPPNGIQDFKNNILVNQLLDFNRVESNAPMAVGGLSSCNRYSDQKSYFVRLDIHPRTETYQRNPVRQSVSQPVPFAQYNPVEQVILDRSTLENLVNHVSRLNLSQDSHVQQASQRFTQENAPGQVFQRNRSQESHVDQVPQRNHLAQENPVHQVSRRNHSQENPNRQVSRHTGNRSQENRYQSENLGLVSWHMPPAAPANLCPIAPSVVTYADKYRGWKTMIGVGELREPSGMAYSSKRNEIFIADCGEPGIQVYKPNGDHMRKLTPNCHRACPIDICMDEQGLLYATHQIVKIRRRNLDPQIVCCDPNNGRVKWSIESGFSNSELCGITYDDGLLFVVDKGCSCVRVYDADTHEHLRHFGVRYLKEPSYVAMGPDNKIYVTDEAHECVYVFNCNGSFCRTFGKRDGSGASGIAVDNKGFVLVARPDANMINVYRPDGELYCDMGIYDKYANRFNRPDKRPGNVSKPEGLQVMPNGSVIVADTGNQRIQIF